MSRTRTLVTDNGNKFLLCKAFSNSTAVITPFAKRTYKDFFSDFVVDKKIKHRVDEILEVVPYVSNVQEYDNKIEIDCINVIEVNLEFFENYPDITSGIIHYDMIVKDLEKDHVICDISPRLLIKDEEKELIESNTFRSELPIVKPFKTNKIKIFSSILSKGFMIGYTTPTNSKLFMVVNKPNEKLVGQCVEYENKVMVNNIKQVWPIFNLSSGKQLKIYIKHDFIDNFSNYKYPILLKLERNLNESEFTVEKLGESVYIKP